MAKTATKSAEKETKTLKAAVRADNTVAGKLIDLYRLQHFDSQTDKIRTQRGELPLEVQDLEDEVAGLEHPPVQARGGAEGGWRTTVADRQNNFIKDAKASIKKYEAQQSKVRNNREYDSASARRSSSRTWRSSLAEKRIKETKFADR
jgi:predicted  nucleic acid-binding Zn-ribbon protein